MCKLSGELTVSLSAIQENYKILDGMSGSNCLTAAVVKADAYGLGMAHVAPVLFEKGARVFFVALLQEAVELRHLLPKAGIFILNGFSPREGSVYIQHNLVPVLNSLEEIAHYRELARRQNASLPCILHFDTGMNRLGIKATELKQIKDNPDLLGGLDIVYVMSHFASSDEKGSAFNGIQAAQFEEIAAIFPGIKKSLSNSSGIFRSADYHYHMVRPGVALYGANPTPEQKNPMMPVLSLKAPVLQVHGALKGETAGYGQSYTFEADTHVAVVSLGYVDGFLRYLSNKGALYWKGYRLPVCGRVSMDLVICDLAAVPEKEYPKLGDHIEVIGPHQSVDDLARTANTISYEILTSLSPRYQRRYEKA